MTSLDRTIDFIRERTAPAPVPLVPEISVYQASALTPLWHATSAELSGWDESPFWAFPWAGGQALARHVLDHPEAVTGRTVLDFATGSGLVAIAAARAGAARVVAADLDPFCRAAVSLNSSLNGVSVSFRAGDPIGQPLDGFEVVLAGDVFYERRLAEDSFAWFRALARRGVRVLGGDADRAYAPEGGIVEIASYDVPTSVEIEDRPVKHARVVEVLP